MNNPISKPKAFFLFPDGNVYLDTLICADLIPAELGGHPFERVR
jgi:hypothetical protein